MTCTVRHLSGGQAPRRPVRYREHTQLSQVDEQFQLRIAAKELDTAVEAFRTRPLDPGPYTFVWVDALTVKVREDGRVVNVHALMATGVNADGPPGDPRSGRRLRRGRGRLVGVPVRCRFSPAACPGSSWSSPTPIRDWSPRWRDSARGSLAAVQNALHDQPDGGDPEVILAVGTHLVAFGVRSARRRIGCQSI